MRVCRISQDLLLANRHMPCMKTPAAGQSVKDKKSHTSAGIAADCGGNREEKSLCPEILVVRTAALWYNGRYTGLCHIIPVYFQKILTQTIAAQGAGKAPGPCFLPECAFGTLRAVSGGAAAHEG